jgi:eukaryotic-like serine/threonine-protein kinase
LDEFPTLPPGTLIAGKLRLTRMLGMGGMGVVYEVEHEITKHRRALKVLHAYAAEQPGVVERFLREASAAGRVGNAHVAETFDAGKLDSGEPYLLMELLDGETLDHLLQRGGPLDPGHLCDLIHQACEGVQAAHDAGIIHRDLKPENLMIVTRDGAPFVKILDFGISKFDAERTGSLKLTTEGLVMGTPYYMSPEQVRGSSTIDARTDIYALGVILYECACGVRPFEAAAIQHLAVLIHEGKPIALAQRRPSLPHAFYDIVSRAMAADRDRRFDSARALANALAPLRTRFGGRAFASPVVGAQPRVAVDTTSGEPRVTGTPRPPGPMPSTDAALAATMAPGTVASAGKRLRAIGLFAVALVLVAAGVAVVFTRSPRMPPIVSVSGAGTTTSEPHLPAVVAPAVPVEVAPPRAEVSAVLAAPAAVAPAAEPLRRATPVTSASARAAGSVSAPQASVPPAATAATKSRVDESGLSRDNPFR